MAPSWSSDGREIAFVSGRGGDIDLWVVDANGGEPRLLAENAGGKAQWSPDGSSIVFNRNGEVWGMSAAGGEEERISRGPSGQVRWSPDGELLYRAGSREQSDRLWVLSPSDGQEYVVADLRGRRGGVAYDLATDGSHLYFTWTENLGDIWVMDVVWDE
jgi:TolB protein